MMINHFGPRVKNFVWKKFFIHGIEHVQYRWPKIISSLCNISMHISIDICMMMCWSMRWQRTEPWLEMVEDRLCPLSIQTILGLSIWPDHWWSDQMSSHWIIKKVIENDLWSVSSHLMIQSSTSWSHHGITILLRLHGSTSFYEVEPMKQIFISTSYMRLDIKILWYWVSSCMSSSSIISHPNYWRPGRY